MTNTSNDQTTTNDQKRPNIIWLVAEDLSPRWAAYGDSLAHTPHMNTLSEQGVVFDNVFSAAGVCAPSRSSLITGMYPSSIGTQHMRQSKSVIPMPGVPNYNAVPPAEVKAFPELLRAAGYWTSSYRKLDYQFGNPFTIWDEVSDYPSWRNRSKEDQDRPFFMYYSFEITHEINIWPDSTKEKFFKDFNIDVTALAPDVQKRPPFDPAYTVNPKDVDVPPFLPDNEVSRSHIARLYDNISRMDVQIGKILQELKEDGLMDNTIIFLTSDHGDCLPRAKRWIYDSGIKCPLVIYFPEKLKPTRYQQVQRDTALYSFLDFVPTVLELANVEIPKYMQGKSMISTLKEQPRDYIYAARDRMDNRYDTRRAVRDHRYKYIRNFQPEVPYSQPIKFLNQMPLMQNIFALEKEGKLNKAQSYWLYHPKNTAEELYDLQNDPFELNNLAADTTQYESVLKRMRGALKEWQQEVNDLYLEEEVVQAERMWPGGKQPVTDSPVYAIQDQKIHLTCSTEGATIAYQYPDHNRWHIYTTPLPLEELKNGVKIKSIRYGYQPSEEVQVQLNF
ncbi:sulfatase-like hydrolase/transferase [Algivirga pacifica]|uniref:Sulfatase-like hydrolase/transferase n=1 Tax=Algivirga pacifica TaxID=1162670 RepID=A0ABP9DBC8_9BACT